jgi:glutamine amidotransferase
MFPGMCQLLGLSASGPVAPEFSLGGFFRRGGDTDHHTDGWGLGFYRGRQCEVLTDERPAAESPLAASLLAANTPSANLIAHVRKATQGATRRSNCHPFRRTLWGRHWLFAHNGDLRNAPGSAQGRYLAGGETDSEAAFCTLLNGLVECFGDEAPGSERLAPALAHMASGLAQHGPFNFLLSDGERLFARCSTELHVVRRAYPFGQARLIDTGEVIDFARHNHAHDRVVVVATRPLTSDEAWERLLPGELRVFEHGKCLDSLTSHSREPEHRDVPPGVHSASRARPALAAG